MNQIAPPDQRAGVCTDLIVSFIGDSLPVIAVPSSRESPRWDRVFAVTLAVLALAALAMSVRMAAARIP